ncbi:MAG: PhnD/SsuA/transferrin family substrate-binding protein [Chromatiales bacterium]|jgi:ABC-type phosphate/phosphonate transport system substrate-binding protein
MRVRAVTSTLKTIGLTAVLAAPLSGVAQEQLILTAPPRESPEAGERMYGPLARQLTELLGRPVVYEHPKAWQTYSFQMRRGRYDIVFDGPHFAAWRMVHIEHVPLVKLPGSLVFVVITQADNDEVRSLDDLNARKVCGIASPNLGTMTLLSQYPNPARQPLVVDVRQGGFKAVYQAWKDGKCEAAVMRDAFFAKKVPEEDKAGIKVIFTSRPVPNQTITVGPRITATQRSRLVEQWLTETGAVGAQGIFQRFSRRTTRFDPADPVAYNGLNNLLEGLVWGW